MGKQGKISGNAYTYVKIIGVTLPIVLLMIIIFFALSRNMILNLSTEKFEIRTQDCAKDVHVWADKITGELNIYKSMIEQLNFKDDRQLFEFIKKSAGVHDEFPLGIYIGDDKGTYIDAAGLFFENHKGITDMNWYKDGIKNEEFAFGGPYINSRTKKTCISVTAKLKYEKAERVIAADVYPDYASEFITGITDEEIDKAFFVTEKDGFILANSDNDLKGITLKEAYKNLKGDDLHIYKNVYGLITSESTGKYNIKCGNDTYLIIINKIDSLGWYFVTCTNEATVVKNLKKMEFIMLAVAIAAVIILTAILAKIVRELCAVKNKAKTDVLTKLLNRDGYRELLLLALETHPGQGVLLMLDMDNFKLINDNLGHPEGDAVLKKFASLLESYFNRNKDVVARIGGDEFSVFVGRQINDKEADEMLRKFVILFHDTFDNAYPNEKLSVSIGASMATENCTYNALYKSADSALYKVKRGGKDGYNIVKCEV